MKRLSLAILIIMCLLMSACGQGDLAEGASSAMQAEQPSFIGEITNSPSGKGSYPDYSGRVMISEVMPKNKTTLVNGQLGDWVELLNTADETVSLDGWKLRGGDSFDLSGMSIVSGERLIIVADKNFSIKDGFALLLIDPEGRTVSETGIPEMEDNVSLVLNESGGYNISLYPTPGYENSKAGYCEYQETLLPEGDIVISEVVVSNVAVNLKQGSAPQRVDWVEIRNISDKKVDISEYCLSDKITEPEKFRFPKKELKPGEYLTVLCAGEEASGRDTAHFGLDSENESLILSRNGEIADCVSLKDIPYGCSFGRMENEAGFFYFEEPSYGKKNLNGCRYVTDSPSASLPGGQYSAEDKLTVELQGTGTIYYTLDSSEPTTASEVYTGPVEIDKSMVLRACACEEGRLRSRSVTYNYLLNTGHTLPVVCINTDSPGAMSRIYSLGDKSAELPGNISYYDGEKEFSLNCSVSMNGATSLALIKKSMVVRFSGAFGCSMLKFPLFDEGVNEFNSLVLRVGQDYYNGVIRNELCQAMAMQFSDDLLTQRGKWCAVYVNGAYYGVHALKENNNAYLYAHRYGVSKDSVIIQSGYVGADSPLYSNLNFILTHDMSDDSNYRKACELVDMNSLADWIIAVGYSGHPDVINGNYKYAASTEDDGRIRLIYYDLDTSLQRPEYPFINIFLPSYVTQMYMLCQSLFRNNDFRVLVLERASDALYGAFSDENALAVIDKMASEIDSEMVMDAPRWRVLSYVGWQGNINRLKTLMSGYHVYVVNNLKLFMRLTNEEVELYFGDLD